MRVRPRGFSKECLEAPAPPSTTSTSTTTAAINTAAAGATSPTTSVFLLAILRLGGIVYEERIERQRVRENKVADIVATDGQGVKRDGVAVSRRHLDRF